MATMEVSRAYMLQSLIEQLKQHHADVNDRPFRDCMLKAIKRCEYIIENTHYVLLIGPHDHTWYGPFNTYQGAKDYLRGVPKTLDALIYTQEDLLENFAKFGEAPITEPIT